LDQLKAPRLTSAPAPRTASLLGVRAIFALAPAARGRLNGVYLASLFAAGAVGSAAGAWAYARDGWTLACLVGLAPPLVALARFLLSAAAGRE